MTLAIRFVEGIFFDIFFVLFCMYVFLSLYLTQKNVLRQIGIIALLTLGTRIVGRIVYNLIFPESIKVMERITSSFVFFSPFYSGFGCIICLITTFFSVNRKNFSFYNLIRYGLSSGFGSLLGDVLYLNWDFWSNYLLKTGFYLEYYGYYLLTFQSLFSLIVIIFSFAYGGGGTGYYLRIKYSKRPFDELISVKKIGNYFKSSLIYLSALKTIFSLKLIPNRITNYFKRGKTWYAIFSLHYFILIFVLYIIGCIHLTFITDEYYYFPIVVDLLNGRVTSPIGWPLLMALIPLAFNTTKYADVRVYIYFLNIVLYSISIFIVGLIAEELVDKRVGIGASFLYLIYPFIWILEKNPAYQAHIALNGLSDNPSTFYLVLAILFFVKANKTNKLYFYALSGVLWGLTTMTRNPNILFMVAPLVLCLKNEKRLETAALFSGFILGYFPELFTNLAQGRIFSPHYTGMYYIRLSERYEVFGINNFLRHFPVLFMLYLFPFIILIFHFRFKSEVRAVFVFLFIWSFVGVFFYSFFYACDTPWFGAYTTQGGVGWVGSRRFLLPIIPSNCIMAGIVLSRFFQWLKSIFL